MFSRTTRRCFATEQGKRALNYLDAWVGSTAPRASAIPEAHRQKTPRQGTNQPPLLLSGSSYLIPTLRIERTDTPESISARISTAMDSSAILQSRGKWHVPLVLDFSALIPDGSPHYTPPSPGLLTGLVTMLGRHGIRVVGVTNTPAALEKEAVSLPSFMPKAQVIDRKTSKINIETVIQMLMAKSQQDSDSAQEQIFSAPMPDETVPDESNTHTTTVAASDVLNTEITSTHVESKNGEQDTANQQVDIDDTNDTNDTDASPLTPNGAMHVYHGSVRSGQQVTAPKNQSLLIIGSVNSGGEVLADGDILVFGKLRGRALAGLAGASTARIVATSFDAELVCIGDTFTTVDTVQDLGLERPGEAAMVTLDDNSSNPQLVFQQLTL